MTGPWLLCCAWAAPQVEIVAWCSFLAWLTLCFQRSGWVSGPRRSGLTAVDCTGVLRQNLLNCPVTEAHAELSKVRKAQSRRHMRLRLAGRGSTAELARLLDC